MKRVVCITVIILLLVAMAPTVLAAGSASMSGPGTVRAGDTITVSFYAGGGIFGGSGSVSYDSSQLTLQGYTQAIGGSWAVEFSGNNFVFYDNSMASPVSGAVIFTATFQVNAVAEGTVIAVSANNVTLSDGKQDMAIGTCTYSVTVAPPLSGNCRLAALSVENASITPGFSPDTLEYSASVPFEISSLIVSAAAEHPGAKVSVNSPGLNVAGYTNVTVTVTAENGAARTYTIRVFRAQDPNYVPSSNANLKELSVEGYILSPVFSPEVCQYYVWLPYETESVAVKGTVEDYRARLTVSQPELLTPGEGTDIAVTVKAEDGTERIYTVTVVRAPAHEDVDRFLNGEPEPTEPTEPDEPETVPTEATTVPTEETVPQTQPTEVPAPDEPPQNVPEISLPVLIVAPLVCALVGAAVGVAAKYAADKRKK